MAAPCICPKCKADLSEDAKARCQQESLGTAFIVKPEAVVSSSVEVYCATCQIWIECECDSTSKMAGGGEK
jgi:hypothetical protein